MKIKKNINLKKYTTFKVGGPAKFFVEIKTKKDLTEAVEWAKTNKEEIFIMSGGSNILVADSGFDGLVIKMANKSFKTVDSEILVCGGGVNLKDCIKKTWQKGFQGMEDLYGIYGNLGGAVRGNAGAFSHEVADFVDQVEIYDLDKNNFYTLDKCELEFDYRTSIIKKNPNLIVWSASLILAEASNEEIRLARKEAFSRITQRKDIHDPRPSAGSVFKNIKGKKYEEFIKANPNIDMPDIFREQKFVAAGWLVENSDLKSFKLRGAEVSDKHGNFVVNNGSAKAEDIVELISLIKTKVRNKFGVQLQEEIQYVGF